MKRKIIFSDNLNYNTVGPPYNVPPYNVFLLTMIKNDRLIKSGGPAFYSLYQ